MRRRRLVRFSVLITSVVSMIGMTPAVAGADDPTAVPVAVLGTQFYGADVSRGWLIDPNVTPTPPEGVTFGGHPVCTKLADGSPIDGSLSPGYHAIDTSTCSGVTLSGPNSAGFHVAYSSARIYVGSSAVNVVVTAPSPTRALVTGKAIFTARVTSRWTGVPAVGVPVSFGLGGTFFTTMCKAVTGATGVATCSGNAVKYVSLLDPSLRFVYANSGLTPYWYYGSGVTRAPTF